MIWLQIPGYEEYTISEKGDLKRTTQNRGTYYAKSWPASNGEKCVALWKNGTRKTHMLHNLYATVFRVSPKKAKQVLYYGFSGEPSAAANVRAWLLAKIQECQSSEKLGVDRHDEILYLQSFFGSDASRVITYRARC